MLQTCRLHGCIDEHWFLWAVHGTGSLASLQRRRNATGERCATYTQWGRRTSVATSLAAAGGLDHREDGLDAQGRQRHPTILRWTPEVLRILTESPYLFARKSRKRPGEERRLLALS